MKRIILSFGVAIIVSVAVCDSHARESTVTLNRAACHQLVEHFPADVAITPGRTVDGRDVALADLDDGPRPQLLEVIPILITSELEDYYDLPFDLPLFEADAVIGLVTYDRAERCFTFNGVELGDPEQRLLAAQCRAAGANLPAN